MSERARQAVAGVYGGFLGLTLVKFGNPVILDHLIQAPANGWELVFSAWPSRWVFNACFGSYFIFGLIFLLTATAVFKPCWAQTWRQLKRHRTVLVASGFLLGWYCWQWIAAMDTVSQALTSATMPHFTLCLFCFAFGLFCLKALEQPGLFWMGLVFGLTIVLWAAVDQRFGGLEATRRMIYEQAGATDYPEEFLQRIAKGRVFGTLFYPNALAGVILMLAPVAILYLHQATLRFGNVIWGIAIGLMGYFAVACLYWSGSKSGWLIAAIMLLAVVLNTSLSKPRKLLVLGIVAALALGAFGLRFSGYFRQGATSVVARFDYWRAAVRITAANPLTGSGPGTFQVPYAALKAPESEMGKLVHNDYLQQGSDSGLPGFILYTGWLLGSIALLYHGATGDRFQFAVWLGLAAWALHSFVEFGLYIPAIAWPAFTLLGWLLGIGMDTGKARNYRPNS